MSVPARQSLAPPEIDALAAALVDCSSSDIPAFTAQLQRARRRLAEGQPSDRLLARLADEVAVSRARVSRRRQRFADLHYPEALPISAHRDELVTALRQQQVLIVAGETGSGKSTQLPKLCLEAGFGSRGRIGHTQPRRIAARGVARRVAEELGCELGAEVGYRIRFSRHDHDDAQLTVMTEGVLLAETRGDPDLRRYDALILDEAHERSLNLDFLLGYLKRLLPRRPELRLVITSATIDPERFAEHFGAAPVVEVSGRGHPVEIRYRPLITEDPEEADLDLYQGVVAAVDECLAEGGGDILVFLPGEAEIRAATQLLTARLPESIEILPLYSRLPDQAQDRIFRPRGPRRVVLATNVAETSLTVPRIRFVVDSGLARVSRFSPTGKVQRLPVERIARSNAVQRAGRCGRTGPGICVRLYDEADFDARPDHPDPEIARTNLAMVLLQMKDLQLGPPEGFPFMQPPGRRLVRAGYHTLHELGALDHRDNLTASGRFLARLPIDPRLGRMLLEATRTGALAEVLVIAAALSVPDPRLRPPDQQTQADQSHAVWSDPRSDFLALLALWREWRDQDAALSASKMRAWCRDRYLSYLRMREWQETHRQLARMMADAGHTPASEPADYEAVHRALLSGLLGQVMLRQERQEYLGARQTRLLLFPGSGVRRRPPKWAVCAEQVETSRLFARMVASIDPSWIEPLAGHLVRRTYHEPWWDPARGEVWVMQKVTLYGLPVVRRRRVAYGPVDPVHARELFIWHALVDGELRTDAPFLASNRQRLERARSAAQKLRQDRFIPAPEVLFRFFDCRLPADVFNAHKFAVWFRKAHDLTPDLLSLTAAEIPLPEQGVALEHTHPDWLDLPGLRLPLRYHYEPGADRDGVTLTIPLAALPLLEPAVLAWQVPGYRLELVTEMIRQLPKSVRRPLPPAPNVARDFLAATGPPAPLDESLRTFLREQEGVDVVPEQFAPQGLPQHLRVRFELVDEDGGLLAATRDLSQLLARHIDAGRRALEQLIPDTAKRASVTAWDFGDLAERIDIAPIHPAGSRFALRPALRLVDRHIVLTARTPGTATDADHATAVRELLRRRILHEKPALLPARSALRTLTRQYSPIAGATVLEADLHDALIEGALPDGEPPRSANEFQALFDAACRGLAGSTSPVLERSAEILAGFATVHHALEQGDQLALVQTAPDIRRQMERLLAPGFITTTPGAWLRRYPIYMQAAALRVQRAQQQPRRDAENSTALQPLETRYWELPPAARQRLHRYRWLIEEMRVSLFAQELGTAEPVSFNRLERVWRDHH
ncbi:MAG: ATP-dependent RNA helicase HrpA [Pseudomonadota bacterium]|nr:ATP-dependent RNA helicase HrpA [Pseudomonadota bacterium]